MSRSRTAVALTLVVAVFGVQAAQSAGPPGQPDAYIVVFDDAVGDAGSVALDHARAYGIRETHVYAHALHGYAARLPDAVLDRVRDDPRVAYVVPDGVVTTDGTEKGAPWGLDRIDQRSRPLDRKYSYTATGLGVTAYVIDSGIRFSHAEFEGRATSGFDAVDGGSADDCFGHGTHVAGLIGGKTYGVAKRVRLVAVRVSNCVGYADWSTVIAGVDWIVADHKAGQPAVANMSLGGARNAAFDDAVKKAIADGVQFVAASGNSSSDACDVSPAGVQAVFTVAASTSNDAWASFSSGGPCVDVAAPGVDIVSAWYTSNTASKVMSGTSMAAPLAAGVGARYLETNGQATNDEFTRALKRAATADVLSGVPPKTTNKLLFLNAAT